MPSAQIERKKDTVHKREKTGLQILDDYVTL